MLIAVFSNLKTLNNRFWRSCFGHAVDMSVIVWVLSLMFLSVLCLSVLSALLLWGGSLRSPDLAVLFPLHFCHKRTCLRRQEGWRLFPTENRDEGTVSLGWWDESAFPQYDIRMAMQVSTSERQEQQQSERECSVVARRIFIFVWQSPERFKSHDDFKVPLESCVLLWVLTPLTVWQFWQFGFLKIV